MLRTRSTRPFRHTTAARSSILEPLEGRTLCAVHAVFLAGPGLLNVFGDNRANVITVGRDAAGGIAVNGGAVRIAGGARAANAAQVRVYGFAGDDQVTFDESHGPLPQAVLFGGSGNDVLAGGSGADLLFGQGGIDFLSGKGGDDLLFGGDGNDSLTGGAGDDKCFGQGGLDNLVWAPGDGSDVNEGGDGFDVVTVNGAATEEIFQASPDGGRVQLGRVAPDVAAITIDIGTAEDLVVRGNAGDDTIRGDAGLGGLIHFTADGGVGNDILLGSDGDDALLGRDGDDFIAGRGGEDLALMGAGDDTFLWNPGDGNDAVDGQLDADTLIFNGSDDPEVFGVSANGSHVRLSRDERDVTADVNGVERFDVNARDGADKVVVNDLTGTDVQEIDVDLAAPTGGNAGDGKADSVIVNGGADGELIPVLGTAGGIMVNGAFAERASLQYFMVIRAVEAADSLQINGNGGDDAIDASALQTPVSLRAEGRAGNDVLLGSPFADVLVGGDGNDSADGNGGADLAFLGSGDDTFVWDPGDGSDIVEGMDGADTLVFRGSNGGETFDLSASGDRLSLSRAPGNVVMDVDDVERVDVVALGGSDTVNVNNLSATDVIAVDINLGAGGTATGDLLADSVAFSGTDAADRIVVSSLAGAPRVTGPHTAVRITGADPSLDTLTVKGLGGDDTIEASDLGAGKIVFAADGGDGNDALTGGAGDDRLVGGNGDDTLVGGPGLDVLDGGPGTNVLVQD